MLRRLICAIFKHRMEPRHRPEQSFGYLRLPAVEYWQCRRCGHLLMPPMTAYELEVIWSGLGFYETTKPNSNFVIKDISEN